MTAGWWVQRVLCGGELLLGMRVYVPRDALLERRERNGEVTALA
jgi:hypothetical protein